MKPKLCMRSWFSAILVMVGLHLGLPLTAIGSVSLTWDANTEADLAGYKLHIASSPGTYTKTIDVGHVTSFTVSNLISGETYYFALTAYDIFANESGFSTEISTTIPKALTPPPEPEPEPVAAMPEPEPTAAPAESEATTTPPEPEPESLAPTPEPEPTAVPAESEATTTPPEPEPEPPATTSLPEDGTASPSEVAASTESVVLAWDRNTEEDLAGYKIHIGTASGTYSQTTDVGNATSFTVAGLLPGETYFFTVTAYDIFANESNYSTEISTTIPEPPPPVPEDTTTPTSEDEATTAPTEPDDWYLWMWNMLFG